MERTSRDSQGANPAEPQGRAEEKRTFYQALSEFMRRNRLVLASILGAVVVATIGLAVFSLVRASNLNAATARLERLSTDLGTWSSEKDAAKKAELEKGLVPSIDELVSKYPKTYAAQRALTVRARLAEEKKDWAQAQKDWAQAAEGFADSYLSPIALHAAAVAAEEAGNAQAAVELYKKLVDGYSGKALGLSHAYFALGRLAETQKDFASAMAHYQKLVSAFPNDDWTKLATDRIISLKARGLAQ